MVDDVEVNVVGVHVAFMYLSLMQLVIVGDGGQRLCSDPKFIRLITFDPGLVCLIIVPLYLLILMMFLLSLEWGIQTCLQVRHSRPWSCLLHKNVSVWHCRLVKANNYVG